MHKCLLNNTQGEQMKTFQSALLYPFLLIIGVLTFGFTQKTNVHDVADEIVSSLKNGNVKELSQHFASTVNMNILGQEGAYSKVQAEIVLREFFQKNTPQEVKTHQKLQSKSAYRFVVLEMTTTKSTYRVSYKLVGVDQSYKISEFRIEPLRNTGV
jgi:hypothetical protein